MATEADRVHLADGAFLDQLPHAQRLPVVPHRQHTADPKPLLLGQACHQVHLVQPRAQRLVRDDVPTGLERTNGQFPPSGIVVPDGDHVAVHIRQHVLENRVRDLLRAARHLLTGLRVLLACGNHFSAFSLTDAFVEVIDVSVAKSCKCEPNRHTPFPSSWLRTYAARIVSICVSSSSVNAAA